MSDANHLPIERHPDLVDVDAAVAIRWYKTADALAEATTRLTGYPCDRIDDSFWKNHVALLEQLEKLQPGVSEKIFTEFERIVGQRREIEDQEYKREARRRRIANAVEHLVSFRFGI